MELTPAQRTELRRVLRKNGLPSQKVREMSDAEMAQKAGFDPAAQQPAKPQAALTHTPAPAANPDQAIDTLRQALSALIPNQPQIDAAALAELVKAEVAKHISKVEISHYDPTKTKTIEGAHKKLPDVLRLLKLAPVTHVWPYLCGPTGSGKTTLAKHAAEALSVEFYYTSTVNDKFELTGFVDAKGDYQQTSFYQAFKNGGLFLFDEKDGSAPEAVLAFNMALANRAFTFPNGERVQQHENCYFMAGGNTFGLGATTQYSAREPMDAAVRNRYICINIDYDTALEQRLALAAAQAVSSRVNPHVIDKWVARVQAVRDYCQKQNLDALFSPRQSMAGAALIADGQDIDLVSQLIFHPELSSQQQQQIKTLNGY